MMLHMLAGALANQASAPNIISIADDSSSHTAEGVAIAGILFKGNGQYAKTIYGVDIDVNNWIAPNTNHSQYEIRATLSSGDTPTGSALNTWLSLATTQAWYLAVSATSSESCELQVQIRWTGNNEVQDTANYALEAVAV